MTACKKAYRKTAMTSVENPQLPSIKTYSDPNIEGYASTMAIDTQWAHGLRGIAAVFVVTGHLMCIIAPWITVPYNDQGETRLFQRPFFRLIVSGSGWVALFFVMLGFVNALKPLRLARAGAADRALHGLSFSSFRRLFRLIIPAAAATILDWFFCNIGAMKYGARSQALWLRETIAAPSETWADALKDLSSALSSTWSVSDSNQYDNHKWAMVYLLQASIFTGAVLMVVINFKSKCRVITLGVFAVWSLDWSFQFHDPLVGFAVFSGIILTELAFSERLLRPLSYLSRFLSPLLLLLAGLCMGYPEDHADKAEWSSTMLAIGKAVAPRQHAYDRFYGSIGAFLLLFTIIITPSFRRALSHPFFLWLGKVSFTMYLLHGLLLRTVFSWVLFAGAGLTPRWTQPDATGETHIEDMLIMPGRAWQTFSVVVFVVVLGFLAHVYTENVEPIFERLAKACEGLLLEEKTIPNVEPSEQKLKGSLMGGRARH